MKLKEETYKRRSWGWSAMRGSWTETPQKQRSPDVWGRRLNNRNKLLVHEIGVAEVSWSRKEHTEEEVEVVSRKRAREWRICSCMRLFTYKRRICSANSEIINLGFLEKQQWWHHEKQQHGILKRWNSFSVYNI
jgi:hypothetical protein